MSKKVKIQLVKVKGKLDRNRYLDLSKEEKDLKLYDSVEHADYPGIEFKFLKFNSWNQEEYVECLDSNNMRRFFYPDSVKKSSKQIKREKRDAKKKASENNRKKPKNRKT